MGPDPRSIALFGHKFDAGRLKRLSIRIRVFTMIAEWQAFESSNIKCSEGNLPSPIRSAVHLPNLCLLAHLRYLATKLML